MIVQQWGEERMQRKCLVIIRKKSTILITETNVGIQLFQLRTVLWY